MKELVLEVQILNFRRQVVSRYNSVHFQYLCVNVRNLCLLEFILKILLRQNLITQTLLFLIWLHFRGLFNTLFLLPNENKIIHLFSMYLDQLISLLTGSTK